MQSKTPRFDAELDAIFAELVPHERLCKQCALPFQIESEDIEFLKKLRVPVPTLCPRCRLQRRMAWRLNLRPIFYKKSCLAPGHTEKVISFLDETNPITVYDDTFYRSEEWDSRSFGTEYDPTKLVSTQLHSLFSRVPHQTLNKDPKSINSDYVVSGDQAANCYYVAVPVLSENMQYGSVCTRSKDSLDFADLDESEQCYGCTRSARCYNCTYCVETTDSVDSYFLYDCKNCMNCFMSSNLRNAKYVWQNEQLANEAYEAKLQVLNLGSYEVMEKCRKEFDELFKTAIHKNLDIRKAENCTGNVIEACRNAHKCFRVLENCENIRHVSIMRVVTDSMDIHGGARSSLLYEGGGLVDSTEVKFSVLIRTGREVEYSTECTNVEFCFGCIGLKGKKFCIFNVQCSEEEYWPKVDEIKAKMLATGEYGEMFSIASSPFPYNDSNAMVEFPLTKEEVLAKGWKWHDDEAATTNVGIDTVKAADLPDSIRDVTDDILHKAVLCIETGKPFRLTPYELNFYRRHNLPLPRLHPYVRITKLLETRIPFHLFDDICKKCNMAIKSGYDPKKMYTVYCEQCYQQEVA